MRKIVQLFRLSHKLLCIKLMSQYNTKKDPCKANACRIQACLKENNYQEDKCLEVLEQMRQCCLKWHKQSLCCSGIYLERPYIKSEEKQNKEEKIKEKR